MGNGGVAVAGLGIRYKRVLERTASDRVVSVRRAFGSHGSLSLKQRSTLRNNVA